jgi:hypothetical protein
MKEITYYQSLITSQYQNKPKFKAWLTALMQPLVDIGNCAKDMYLAFDIDNAVGAQQDILGEILGAARKLPYQPANNASAILNDDDYRVLLKAKVIQNQWDGKITTIESLWRNLFSDSFIIIVDNQNMTMNIAIAGSFTPMAQEMITKGLIVPRPEGVKLNLGIDNGPVTFEPAIFGYDQQDAVIDGYNVGYWGGI